MKITCLSIFYVLFYSADTALISTTENIDLNKNHGNDVCENGYCGQTSYNYLLKVFRGLFHSASEIAMLDNVNNAALSTPLSNHDQLQSNLMSESSNLRTDDGALCCSTRVQHIANTTMINIFGVSTSIVHLSDAVSPSFQYIPHASCQATGSCPGQCVIERKILTLLTLDAEQQLKFDLFDVPGYCSCKGIY